MKRLLAVAFLLPLILCGEKRAETSTANPAL